MKWSCPAVLLVCVAKVQLDKRVVEVPSRYTVDEGGPSRYTVDEGVETKVQSNAAIVPEL